MDGIAHLPGAELVLPGLEDLRAGRWTPEALLVLIGRPRMVAAGLDIPFPDDAPGELELTLYAMLGERYGDDAYSKYNSLLRRLISFESAVEHAARRRRSP